VKMWSYVCGLWVELSVKEELQMQMVCVNPIQDAASGKYAAEWCTPIGGNILQGTMRPCLMEHHQLNTFAIQ
jgi:hypothetical protein